MYIFQQVGMTRKNLLMIEKVLDIIFPLCYLPELIWKKHLLFEN